MNTLDFMKLRFDVKDTDKSPVQLPYTRQELANLFKTLEYTCGAEIGVDKGIFSEVLAKDNPQLRLYCIDPWKIYRKYEDIKDEHEINVRYGITQKRLAPYNCKIIRKSSLGALDDFRDGSLDFVYIDGNHTYDYVWEDINAWTKKVKIGGIISGHDYRSVRHALVGVSRAVDKYMLEHNIKMLFRFAKNNDSSWAFVNE
jgi:hypothetical protein